MDPSSSHDPGPLPEWIPRWVRSEDSEDILQVCPWIRDQRPLQYERPGNRHDSYPLRYHETGYVAPLCVKNEGKSFAREFAGESSARRSRFLSNIDALVTRVLDQHSERAEKYTLPRESAQHAPSTFVPEASAEIDAWISKLADPCCTSCFSPVMDAGLKREHVIGLLCDASVPLPRAVWYIRLLGSIEWVKLKDSQRDVNPSSVTAQWSRALIEFLTRLLQQISAPSQLQPFFADFENKPSSSASSPPSNTPTPLASGSSSALTPGSTAVTPADSTPNANPVIVNSQNFASQHSQPQLQSQPQSQPSRSSVVQIKSRLSAEASDWRDKWKVRWRYALDLMQYLDNEDLVAHEIILRWVLDLFDTCTMPQLAFVVPLCVSMPDSTISATLFLDRLISLRERVSCFSNVPFALADHILTAADSAVQEITRTYGPVHYKLNRPRAHSLAREISRITASVPDAALVFPSAELVSIELLPDYLQPLYVRQLAPHYAQCNVPCFGPLPGLDEVFSWMIEEQETAPWRPLLVAHLLDSNLDAQQCVEEAFVRWPGPPTRRAVDLCCLFISRAKSFSTDTYRQRATVLGILESTSSFHWSIISRITSRATVSDVARVLKYIGIHVPYLKTQGESGSHDEKDTCCNYATLDKLLLECVSATELEYLLDTLESRTRLAFSSPAIRPEHLDMMNHICICLGQPESLLTRFLEPVLKHAQGSSEFTISHALNLLESHSHVWALAGCLSRAVEALSAIHAFLKSQSNPSSRPLHIIQGIGSRWLESKPHGLSDMNDSIYGDLTRLITPEPELNLSDVPSVVDEATLSALHTPEAVSQLASTLWYRHHKHSEFWSASAVRDILPVAESVSVTVMLLREIDSRSPFFLDTSIRAWARCALSRSDMTLPLDDRPSPLPTAAVSSLIMCAMEGLVSIETLLVYVAEPLLKCNARDAAGAALLCGIVQLTCEDNTPFLYHLCSSQGALASLVRCLAPTVDADSEETSFPALSPAVKQAVLRFLWHNAPSQDIPPAMVSCLVLTLGDIVDINEQGHIEKYRAITKGNILSFALLARETPLDAVLASHLANNLAISLCRDVHLASQILRQFPGSLVPLFADMIPEALNHSDARVALRHVVAFMSLADDRAFKSVDGQACKSVDDQACKSGADDRAFKCVDDQTSKSVDGQTSKALVDRKATISDHSQALILQHGLKLSQRIASLDGGCSTDTDVALLVGLFEAILFVLLTNSDAPHVAVTSIASMVANVNSAMAQLAPALRTSIADTVKYAMMYPSIAMALSQEPRGLRMGLWLVVDQLDPLGTTSLGAKRARDDREAQHVSSAAGVKELSETPLVPIDKLHFATFAPKVSALDTPCATYAPYRFPQPRDGRPSQGMAGTTGPFLSEPFMASVVGSSIPAPLPARDLRRGLTHRFEWPKPALRVASGVVPTRLESHKRRVSDPLQSASKKRASEHTDSTMKDVN